MRILLVWPYAPWPPVTGTSRRLARLTEELQARDEFAHVVVNDRLEDALAQLVAIVSGELGDPA